MLVSILLLFVYHSLYRDNLVSHQPQEPDPEINIQNLLTQHSYIYCTCDINPKSDKKKREKKVLKYNYVITFLLELLITCAVLFCIIINTVLLITYLKFRYVVVTVY